MDQSTNNNDSPIDTEYLSYSLISNYYNTYSHIFKDCKNELGLNLWFIEQYRLKFNLSNSLTEEQSKIASKGLPPSIIQKINLTIKLIGRVLGEILFMFIQLFRKNKIPKTNHLVINTASHYRNGSNKFLGDLVNSYDFIINRSLFDLKTKTYKIKYPKVQISSDYLIASRIIRGSFITDFIQFRNAHNKLKFKLINETKNKDKTTKHITSLFIGQFISHYLYFLRYRAYLRFFNYNRYLSIIMCDENSPQQKVIQYAAEKYSIKTIAIQHGNIHKQHPAYIYKNYKTKPLLPNITLVWGAYFKSILINHGGYKTENIKVIGRIESANIEKKINHDINIDKKTILFISQPIREEKIRKSYMKDVLHTASRLPKDFQLIIRPHPREVENTFFNEIAKEVKFDNFIIDRKSDLESQMKSCSFMIVAFSTVGTEFIRYMKPLLILDYLKQDLMNWIADGIGIPIYNSEELYNTITQQNLTINKSKHADFITNYFYKNDGEAEKRAIHIINSSSS